MFSLIFFTDKNVLKYIYFFCHFWCVHCLQLLPNGGINRDSENKHTNVLEVRGVTGMLLSKKELF